MRRKFRWINAFLLVYVIIIFCRFWEEIVVGASRSKAREVGHVHTYTNERGTFTDEARKAFEDAVAQRNRKLREAKEASMRAESDQVKKLYELQGRRPCTRRIYVSECNQIGSIQAKLGLVKAAIALQNTKPSPPMWLIATRILQFCVWKNS